MKKPVEIGWSAKAIAAYPSKEKFMEDHAHFADQGIDLNAVWDKYKPDTSEEKKKK